MGTDLFASLTLVGLLPTVDTLVPLQVVALDKPHITHVTSKWLLSYKSTQIQSHLSVVALLNQHQKQRADFPQHMRS